MQSLRDFLRVGGEALISLRTADGCFDEVYLSFAAMETVVRTVYFSDWLGNSLKATDLYESSLQHALYDALSLSYGLA